jgi:hypothetical protein
MHPAINEQMAFQHQNDLKAGRARRQAGQPTQVLSGLAASIRRALANLRGQTRPAKQWAPTVVQLGPPKAIGTDEEGLNRASAKVPCAAGSYLRPAPHH